MQFLLSRTLLCLGPYLVLCIRYITCAQWRSLGTREEVLQTFHSCGFGRGLGHRGGMQGMNYAETYIVNEIAACTVAVARGAIIKRLNAISINLITVRARPIDQYNCYILCLQGNQAPKQIQSRRVAMEKRFKSLFSLVAVMPYAVFSCV